MDLNKAIPNANNALPSGLAAFDATEAAPEFTPLPPGIYTARIVRGEYCSTKIGAEAYRLRFEVTDGPEIGKTVVRTWTFSPKALPYTKRDLAQFGLTTTAKLLAPFPEPCREYLVQLVVANQLGDDGVERNDVKRITLLHVNTSPAAKFQLPDEDEGGPK